jgi:hypothetical protein
MKKAPIIIFVPLAAVMLIVVAAMLYKIFGTTPHQSEVVSKSQVEYPNAVGNSSTGKPTNYLGNLFGIATPTPTPAAATAADLSNELKGTVDDGGKTDLDAIARDAADL